MINVFLFNWGFWLQSVMFREVVHDGRYSENHGAEKFYLLKICRTKFVFVILHPISKSSLVNFKISLNLPALELGSP